jgi:hypothetical protein
MLGVLIEMGSEGMGAYRCSHLCLATERCSFADGRRIVLGHCMRVQRLLAGRKGWVVHICSIHVSIAFLLVRDSKSFEGLAIAIVDSVEAEEETNPYCDMIVSIKFCQR